MPQNNAPEEDWVCRIIHNTFTQIFGEKATSIIYKYLETHYSLEKGEFSSRIDVFAQGLESFLQSSATLIERRILEETYSAYGLRHRIERLTEREIDFVNEMRFAMRA